MKILIIGGSSQLSHYLPNEYIRISSRNIPETIYNENWDKVYILFAEQRTLYSNDIKYKSYFYDINVNKTLEVIKKLHSKQIIFLSTTELWNLCNGPIDLDTKFNFIENYYTDSKFLITNKLKNFDNVVICYPFNFNSSYRNENFLFGKIFKSIKNKTKITVGNINLERELLHAKYVAERLKNINSDEIIGAGRLINIKNFIIDLYNQVNLSYNEYVIDDSKKELNNNKFYYSKITNYSYDKLLKDYYEEL